MIVPHSKQDLGEWLCSRDIISPEQLQHIRSHQKKNPIATQRLILNLNLASEQDTIQGLAEIHSIPFRDLDNFRIPSTVLDAVPLKLIFHYRFIPLEVTPESLTVAFGDLPNSLEIANLRLLLKRDIHFALAPPSQIDAVIKSEFGLGAETVQKLRETKADLLNEGDLVFDLTEETAEKAVDGTISELVDQILREALRLRTTDIHFEPYADAIKLRYRIDGILQNIPVPAELKPLYSAIVSRLKVMAELDISDRRFPQDGRISMKTDGEEYDLRVSVIPTKHGEALCLRILGRQSLLLGLEELGMLPKQQEYFSQLVRLPQGLIIISGPTGSGKTTTLYGALGLARQEQRKIITIEDPVEYQIEGVAQMQTRDDIGLTFAKGLRAVLRHDPDVVLVGEIRDQETAEIAVRAAQTGHLVLSTLHANDSLAAIPRMVNMGVDPTILSASLNCSIAQRLTRKICRRCGTVDTSPQTDLRNEMAKVLELPASQLQTMTGEGCVECQNTGVKGRLALYEFASINELLAEKIYQRAGLVELRSSATQLGWRSLRDVAFHRVQEGTLSLTELQRITWKLDFAGI